MPSAIFKRNLESINVELSDKQLEQLDKYYEILVEWNSFMNLTGITEYEEVMLKHYLDSLVLKLPIDGGNLNIKLIDVGTGAGFPGLPLKIAYPDTEVVLFDSLNKRIKFLDEVIAQLGLKGISTVHGRAEDGGKSKNNLMSVYQGQSLIYQYFQNIIFHLLRLVDILLHINQERLMRSLRSLRKLYPYSEDRLRR